MRESLSEKEILFLTALADLLMQYHAMFQCGENKEMEILVFEGLYEDTNTPIGFSDCLDETDIEKLLKSVSEGLKG